MRGLRNLCDVQDIFFMRNVREKLPVGVVIIPMIERKMPTHLGWMFNLLEGRAIRQNPILKKAQFVILALICIGMGNFRNIEETITETLT